MSQRGWEGESSAADEARIARLQTIERLLSVIRGLVASRHGAPNSIERMIVRTRYMIRVDEPPGEVSPLIAIRSQTSCFRSDILRRSVPDTARHAGTSSSAA